jgi:hypothetical protein
MESTFNNHPYTFSDTSLCEISPASLKQFSRLWLFGLREGFQNIVID